MDLKNPLYKNQGIHANMVLLTCDNGVIKVLLVKRTNNPFFGHWALPGGAVYNNETVEQAINRELYEKTSIKTVKGKMFDVFSDVNRAPQMRMICVAYLAVIDKTAINFVKQTAKTNDANWFDINSIPSLLAYDHNKIINGALQYLKNEIWKSGILKTLYPSGVTLPELHKLYSTILGQNLDRRNFRKKMLGDGLLIDTGELMKQSGKKSSKIYLIR